MQVTFKPQAKSNAKRFLINTCAVEASNVDAYLTQVDGQWGTWINEDGKAVELVLVNAQGSDEEAVEPAGEPTAEPTVEPVVGSNPFAQLLGVICVPAPSNASTVVVDGRIVNGADPTTSNEDKAPRTPAVRSGNTQKGYTIDKGRETRNGVTRPSAETICGKVWAYFDANPSQVGTPIRPIAEANGWSKITVSCQLRVWRKFHGISAK